MSGSFCSLQALSGITGFRRNTPRNKSGRTLSENSVVWQCHFFWKGAPFLPRHNKAKWIYIVLNAYICVICGSHGCFFFCVLGGKKVFYPVFPVHPVQVFSFAFLDCQVVMLSFFLPTDSVEEPYCLVQ